MTTWRVGSKSLDMHDPRGRITRQFRIESLHSASILKAGLIRPVAVALNPSVLLPSYRKASYARV